MITTSSIIPGCSIRTRDTACDPTHSKTTRYYRRIGCSIDSSYHSVAVDLNRDTSNDQSADYLATIVAVADPNCDSSRLLCYRYQMIFDFADWTASFGYFVGLVVLAVDWALSVLPKGM